MHCSASIQYDEETMRQMVKVRMRTFRSIASYGLLLIGAVLIGVGVLSSYSTVATRTMMVAIGCFMVVGVNSPETYMAKKIVQSMNGNFPKLSYDFGFDAIKIRGADTMNRLEYEDILRLVEEENYLYIFLKNKSAFMIDCKTVKPKVNSLKELLTEKTGLGWTRPHRIAAVSLYSILRNRRNTKNGKTAKKNVKAGK